MKTLIFWINNNATTIQAISSTILTLFTIMYVIYTKKLVLKSSEAKLIVSEIELPVKNGNINIAGVNLYLLNSGPSSALNINIEMELNPLIGSLNENKSYSKLNGPYTLLPGEKTKYSLTDTENDLAIPEISNIKITYMTHTGEKYVAKWFKNKRKIEFISRKIYKKSFLRNIRNIIKKKES
ncbi:hypothetical protein [Sporosalibacterium faouarense]|uniref:hypothetical protein n=1 Tax=Sporosalibacterium faouarense TaxID=516123 RepID=UPI00192C658F|nr:hypothetical protein [Sporosalibacterium faouarense]